MKFNNLITIDGLSGAGKGTLALNLAYEFNYGILDSGALYRLVGLVSQRMDSKDPEIIEKEIGSKNSYEFKSKTNGDRNFFWK